MSDYTESYEGPHTCYDHPEEYCLPCGGVHCGPVLSESSSDTLHPGATAYILPIYADPNDDYDTSPRETI